LRIAAGMFQLDFRTFRQLADDFVQGGRRGGAGALAGGGGGDLLDHGDFHVGRGQRQPILVHGDHDVGQDRDRVALFHHALDMRQRLQQGGTIGLEPHGVILMGRIVVDRRGRVRRQG